MVTGGISACVVVKSVFNKVYQPIFLLVLLSVKFRNTNHIGLVYGKFRIYSSLCIEVKRPPKRADPRQDDVFEQLLHSAMIANET